MANRQLWLDTSSSLRKTTLSTYRLQSYLSSRRAWWPSEARSTSTTRSTRRAGQNELLILDTLDIRQALQPRQSLARPTGTKRKRTSSKTSVRFVAFGP
eukprot:6449747-Prymnesium_polylepis.1